MQQDVPEPQQIPLQQSPNATDKNAQTKTATTAVEQEPIFCCLKKKQQARSAMTALVKEIKDAIVTDVANLFGVDVSVTPNNVCRKRDLDAGASVVNHLERLRVEQAQKHQENVMYCKQVEGQARLVEGKGKAWSAFGRDAPKVLQTLDALSASVAQCTEQMHTVCAKMGELERLFVALDKEQNAKKVVEWNQKAEESVKEEQAKLELEYQEKFRNALQASFEEQMRRFKQSGLSAVVANTHDAVPPAKSISDIILDDDANDKEELDKFLE